MTLLELLDRLHRGEHLHTEFKEAEVHADDIASDLVAFANTDGGQLIFGVTDDGRIVGVADADRLAQRVDQTAYNNCEPLITVVQETVHDEAGRAVLIVNVPKGDQRPYQTKQRGDFFIRTGSGRRRASRQELLCLFQSAESLYYDETLLVQATLADLDGSAIERFTQQAYQRSVEESGGLETLLRKLRLAHEHGGIIRPTVPRWQPCSFSATTRSNSFRNRIWRRRAFREPILARRPQTPSRSAVVCSIFWKTPGVF